MLSTYSTFDLEIDTNEQLMNVTLYLPLPVKNGTPYIGTASLSQNNFEKNNFVINFVQKPPGLDENGTSPEDHNAWYVKITADEIEPDPKRGPVYKVRVENISTIYSPHQFLNTRDPVGSEAIYLPKWNISLVSSGNILSENQDSSNFGPGKYSETIFIYADYHGPDSSKVTIYSSVYGSNSWKERNDESGYNYYRNSFSWYYTGESYGWQPVTGELLTGGGTYPNLSHPTWQKMLDATS